MEPEKESADRRVRDLTLSGCIYRKGLSLSRNIGNSIQSIPEHMPEKASSPEMSEQKVSITLPIFENQIVPKIRQRCAISQFQVFLSIFPCP